MNQPPNNPTPAQNVKCDNNDLSAMCKLNKPYSRKALNLEDIFYEDCAKNHE